jgi:hypothetical protein
MSTLIDHRLSEVAPQEKYPLFNDDHSFFCGHIIKSNYDEKRLLISKKLNPKRFTFKTTNNELKLYGTTIPAPYNHKLTSMLVKQSPKNIYEYNSILTANGLSCFSCFLHFSPELYPIDSTHINKLFTGLNIEKDFSIKRGVPNFQRVGHIYLFVLLKRK